MAKNIERIARKLGAEVVCEVPEVGGGAFGMARLAGIMAALQQRLQPGQGQRPGRPTDAQWVHHPKVPMSAETEERLSRLAALASTPERKVSPMQLAAQLLEEAVARVAEQVGDGR
ncbi:MAG TPA: hypothetical protein VK395_13700 [Gemmataceae bacterium]|nr:hypothetical protein [Gemmataceae bacterium]